MKICVLMISGIISGAICLSACNSAKSNMVTEIHQAQIQKEGIGMIYVDEVPCRTVIQNEDSAGSFTAFHCFRVGFIDSLTVAKAPDKKSLETGKYYEYDMQKDWTMLVNKDSLKAVFYQTRQKMESHRYEGILVFEIPKDKVPDKLIYVDSYSTWGVQQLIINSNKK